MTSDELYWYAARFQRAAEARGKGTQYATVRAAARRFRCRQQDILDAVEDSYFKDERGLDLLVGYAVRGCGNAVGSIDNPADYLIEAY